MGPLWPILEASWAVLDVLKASNGAWGAYWKPFGGLLGRFGRVLGRRRSANQTDAGAARVRRGCDAGADGVPMSPGAATIKEYQYTRHQDWITRHAEGQKGSNSILLGRFNL